MNFYGNVKELTLPHSGLVVRYAAGFYPLREQQGLLQPDLPVVRTFQDAAKAKDPVLAAALHLALPELAARANHP